MVDKTIYNNWCKFFEESGINPSLSQKYLVYISRLLDLNVPIIFDFKHLSLLLGRKLDYLSSVINSSDKHYRSFKIRKRSGGVREISSPYPALLEMQYWILNNILSRHPINPCAHGFVKKKSILSNGRVHLGQKELLKIDIRDFFPSITINRIIYVFKSLGYPNQIAFYLARICSLHDCLPQGAPTSPTISNIVCNNLDNRLFALSKKFDLRYSRYADDLTFSGARIPAKLIIYIDQIVLDEGFNINSSKTRLYQGSSKRIVTGLSVSGVQLKVPREFKRKLHQEINFINKYGFVSHIKKMRIKNPNYLHSILGRLNFVRMVEPDNKFIQAAISNINSLMQKNLFP